MFGSKCLFIIISIRDTITDVKEDVEFGTNQTHPSKVGNFHFTF